MVPKRDVERHVFKGKFVLNGKREQDVVAEEKNRR